MRGVCGGWEWYGRVEGRWGREAKGVCKCENIAEFSEIGKGNGAVDGEGVWGQ